MSHFSVMVTNTQKIDLEKQLEPFWEDGEEGDYWMKHEVRCEAGIENYRAYIQKEYIDYYREEMSKGDGDRSWENRQLAKWGEIIKNDNEAYLANAISEEEGYSVDNKGNLYVLENPNAKWDWWVVGGRCNNRLITKDGKQCNSCKVKDIDFDKSIMPFALLHEGRWIEEGKMGWWGTVSNRKEPESWEKEFKNALNTLDPEMEVTIVDCHI